jgi:hypothetical protein
MPCSPAADLNQTCHCITLDDALLDRALVRESESFGLAQLSVSHPHLFSRSALFVDPDTLSSMREVVAAVERVTALPGYLERALGDTHPHARFDPRTRGAFLGFDFHLSAAGPQLIEINTNAGGGLLNALLRSAQRACCGPVAEVADAGERALHSFFSMFEEEWRLARGTRPLQRVAIVDDAPEKQFLYPEFVLFARMCTARGLSAVICDPSELVIEGDRVLVGGEPVDLVYNRLTDFALAEPRHARLSEAYLRDLVVVTPHPRAHAVYADKRRLAVLSDRAALKEVGVSDADAELLIRHVPRTLIVSEAQREALWRERKSWFFKPQSGYGSKAAYRGDKITKTVFEQVLREPYVAQVLVPPSARTLRVGDQLLELKVDVRNFAYGGRVQLVCARLYQGQTTNFRTVGGGFAPVYETRC